MLIAELEEDAIAQERHHDLVVVDESVALTAFLRWAGHNANPEAENFSHAGMSNHEISHAVDKMRTQFVEIPC